MSPWLRCSVIYIYCIYIIEEKKTPFASYVKPIMSEWGMWGEQHVDYPHEVRMSNFVFVSTPTEGKRMPRNSRIWVSMSKTFHISSSTNASERARVFVPLRREKKRGREGGGGHPNWDRGQIPTSQVNQLCHEVKCNVTNKQTTALLQWQALLFLWTYTVKMRRAKMRRVNKLR